MPDPLLVAGLSADVLAGAPGLLVIHMRPRLYSPLLSCRLISAICSTHARRSWCSSSKISWRGQWK